MTKIKEIIEGIRNNKIRKLFLVLIILGFILGIFGDSTWEELSVAIIGGSFFLMFIDDNTWKIINEF